MIATRRPSFDVHSIRKDFPILRRQVHGKPLVYLDNAATTQKPQAVIDSMVRYYTESNSNIHRGVHSLSEQATREYEEARVKAQHFVNARSSSEIVFVRGATEAVNLVAYGYARPRVKPGDEILISEMEHHSNIVPWQILCEEKGCKLAVAPIGDDGALLIEEFERLVNERTILVSMAHVSNALGTINPLRRIIKVAHELNVPVLVDGAQAAPHMKIDVRELDCDFYAISGHKMYGPTGIGVLYGRAGLLEEMAPYQGGGDMINSVTFEKTTFNSIPYKFEAGTPNIAGAIGLGAAMDYLNGIGLDAIAAHEDEVLAYATRAVGGIPGVKLIGTAKKKAGVLSFTIEGVHPHDAGTILDYEGIAVRTGHHCAQPVMERFGVPATTRASIGLYNTKDEIDALVKGIHKVKEVFE
jgi:cysteine desulfurase/selenocysteine lyase